MCKEYILNKDDLLYFSFFLLELIIFFPTDGLIFCFLLIINLWDWPGWYRTLFFLAFLKRIQAQHSQSHKIILEATKLRCKSREDLTLRVLQKRTCSSFFLFSFSFSPSDYSDFSLFLLWLTSMATWNCSCSFLSCSASARQPGMVKLAISMASVFWIHRIT